MSARIPNPCGYIDQPARARLGRMVTAGAGPSRPAAGQRINHYDTCCSPSVFMKKTRGGLYKIIELAWGLVLDVLIRAKPGAAQHCKHKPGQKNTHAHQFANNFKLKIGSSGILTTWQKHVYTWYIHVSDNASWQACRWHVCKFDNMCRHVTVYTKSENYKHVINT